MAWNLTFFIKSSLLTRVQYILHSEFYVNPQTFDSCPGRLCEGTVLPKEYILVIEGTALAIVLQRCDSPNLSPPVLSDGQVVGDTADQRI